MVSIALKSNVVQNVSKIKVSVIKRRASVNASRSFSASTVPRKRTSACPSAILVVGNVCQILQRQDRENASAGMDGKETLVLLLTGLQQRAKLRGTKQ